MGVCCVLQAFHVVESPSIAPYFGTSTDEVPTAAMILSLGGRGSEVGASLSFSLNALPNQYQYFAYPALYGPVNFYDEDSHLTGGWDGASDDPYSAMGPKVLSVTIAGITSVFYVYRTDYPGLGACRWTTSLL
jgi:hypothetical protein